MRRTLSGANKDQRLAARYIPKGARCVLEHTNGSACYVYEVTGTYYALGYRGTAARSEFHYSYRTEDQRNQAVWNFKVSIEQSIARRTTDRIERATAICTLTVGDVVNTSWGYDQTNVDFYVVTRVSAKCVWVRPIAADGETTGAMSGRTWPKMPITPTGAETRHVCRGSYFSIDGHSASLTTGDTYESWYA